MAAYHLVYDLRQLQADCQNRDQLRNHTLGNRLWATFTFLARRSHEPPRTSARPIGAVGRVDDRLDNRFV